MSCCFRSRLADGLSNRTCWAPPSSDSDAKTVTIPQQIHAGTLNGAVVSRTDHYIAFLDHEPVTRGHTLVCPVRRVDSIFDLSSKERVDFLDFAEEVEALIRKILKPLGISQIMNDGPFNELGHLHLHLIPRYEDDGFAWTAAANGRRHSIPELETIAQKLREAQG